MTIQVYCCDVLALKCFTLPMKEEELLGFLSLFSTMTVRKVNNQLTLQADSFLELNLLLNQFLYSQVKT